MNSIFSALIALLRDPVPYRGLIGFVASVTLEHLNSIVGLLVGLATLVYLCLRIRREVIHRHRPPADD